MNTAAKKRNGGGHFNPLLIAVFFLSHFIFLVSCAKESYDIAPYSEDISWRLISHELDVNDAPPKTAKELIDKTVEIHFYYKPNQDNAFPIIDYRQIKPTFTISDANEVINFLDVLRNHSLSKKSSENLSGTGTLHIVVEFMNMPKKSAYYIYYFGSASITPIFSYDAASFSHSGILDWLVSKYPHIFEEKR